MGIQDKIKDIEAEMARTQKNKATEGHLGLLKAKLARLKTQLMEGSAKSSSKGEGFDTRKSGDARVALIGFPSVGKSTLLSTVTKTKSETANYEFTTLTCVPGVIEYMGSRIQLLDLPGIIEGASKGKGRGRQVIAVARTADLIVMMLDASKGEIHKKLLKKELEDVGIRINKQKPEIYFKERKKGGGLHFSTTCKQTILNEKLVKEILYQYKIFNADVILRYDATVDDFIDVVEGNRQYIRCIYVYNKIDTITIEEIDVIARTPLSVVISCVWKLNLDYLVAQMWANLKLIRVYTKKKGKAPDFVLPFILREGSTVKTVCKTIHADLMDKFKWGLVWGKSTKHSPQRVGINHELADEDVLQIVAGVI